MSTEAQIQYLGPDYAGWQLYEAVLRQDVAAVAALAPDADLEYVGPHGYTVLGLAAMGGMQKISELLLEAGADPYRKGPGAGLLASAPVEHFVTSGNAHLVRAALKRRDRAGSEQPDYARLLFTAFCGDKLEVFKALLDTGVSHSTPLVLSDVVNSPMHDPYTLRPMHYAVSEDTSYMQALYDAGASVNVFDSAELTPLHRAAQAGSAKACEWLCAHGARLDVAFGPVNHTPPMVAAAADKVSALQAMLRSGASARAADEEGKTVLHVAAMFGSVGCARLLVEHGADINADWRQHGTPLMAAASADRPEMVKLLLKFGADLSGAASKVPFDVFVNGCSPAVQEAYRNRSARAALSARLKKWWRPLFG